MNLGATAVVSLRQEPVKLVAAMRREFEQGGIDIVLDYLWGPPAECIFEAVAGQGMRGIASRIRYLQIGTVAGPRISLDGATLRSSGLEILGSGFGSVAVDKILAAVREFMDEAVKAPFQVKTRTESLREVGSLWNFSVPGVRLVFQP